MFSLWAKSIRGKSLRERAERPMLRYRHETTAERTANWPMLQATIEDAERIYAQASLTPQNS